MIIGRSSPASNTVDDVNRLIILSRFIGLATIPPFPLNRPVASPITWSALMADRHYQTRYGTVPL